MNNPALFRDKCGRIAPLCSLIHYEHIDDDEETSVSKGLRVVFDNLFQQLDLDA